MAVKRKAEVESQIENGTYSPPAMQTVSEFLKEFVEVYGANKWSMSTYSAREGIIRNYVEPFIGSVPLSELSTRMMDKYYQALLHQTAAPRPGRSPELITPRTVIEVHPNPALCFQSGHPLGIHLKKSGGACDASQA